MQYVLCVLCVWSLNEYNNDSSLSVRHKSVSIMFSLVLSIYCNETGFCGLCNDKEADSHLAYMNL